MQVRNGVKSIKKVKGKAGKPDKIELIVNVNPVSINISVIFKPSGEVLIL